ncbi:MAG: helicase C-terminal domain-containing protein [archaeon]
MSTPQFNALGQFIGVDDKTLDIYPQKSKKNLITSGKLEFLKPSQKLSNDKDTDFWSLYEKDKLLSPLKFSNGKTQEDVTKEIVDLIKSGKKVIFLHGVCGTGKSAIALNIARALGTASIVVPVKALQKQYEEDYMGEKYVIKTNGEKMKIAMITGRDNHDSIIFPGKSCADPFLPDTIKITEKNRNKLKEYYRENPFISNDSPPPIRRLRRLSIAPANPYWSPILPAEREINQLIDAKKRRYVGMFGREFIFYHRKHGCSYYDQYLSYFEADVIIFNSAKYLAEVSLGRKPKTQVDIIDEADEFLDKFSNNVEINLTRLEIALRTIVPEMEQTDETIKKIRQLITLEETNKRVLGINENEVFELKNTKIADILKLLTSDHELEAEIQMDEMNYANEVLEAARDFRDSLDETFLTYRKEDDFLNVKLVTINLAKKFKEIVDGNKALVLMSGTLHSEEVLKHIFGIEEFVNVKAETLNQGSIEIFLTGKEIDCRYSNLQANPSSRKDYLKALALTIEKAVKPALVHVNAYKDLPTSKEGFSLNLINLMTKDLLLSLQRDDKNGELVSQFKKGKTDTLFTTKCTRGVDFPGDTCHSVIFTKYPNPNVRDTFWEILKKVHPNYYWEFYRDKAQREFLQRIYRAVRSKDDHVYVLSPDIRVLQAVRKLQINGN